MTTPRIRYRPSASRRGEDFRTRLIAARREDRNARGCRHGVRLDERCEPCRIDVHRIIDAARARAAVEDTRTR